MTAIEKLYRCPTHPRYQAKRKPQCLCVPCWEYFVFKKSYTEMRVEIQKRIEKKRPAPHDDFEIQGVYKRKA